MTARIFKTNTPLGCLILFLFGMGIPVKAPKRRSGSKLRTVLAFLFSRYLYSVLVLCYNLLVNTSFYERCPQRHEKKQQPPLTFLFRKVHTSIQEEIRYF